MSDIHYDIEGFTAGLAVEVFNKDQLVAMGFGFGDDRMANNIDRYGNTTAATEPTAPIIPPPQNSARALFVSR